mmetsp:Transcript_5894/g.11691  ORF Transcript_5894/g.11691 Transcript_5894/m.11691 type:complete len:89 (-) Transcript_5894:728-994(-)
MCLGEKPWHSLAEIERAGNGIQKRPHAAKKPPARQPPGAVVELLFPILVKLSDMATHTPTTTNTTISISGKRAMMRNEETPGEGCDGL